MSESAPSSTSAAASDNRASDDADPAPASDDPQSPEPDGAGPLLLIDLVMETRDLDPPLVGWLEPVLRQLAEHAGVERGRLTVLAVDDDAMSDLHKQYAGVEGTTDVLTFDLRDPPPEAPEAPDAADAAPPPAEVEGDIAICLDEAQRQARRRGHDARLEALLYALHGLLHLLGEDDHDPDAYQRMHAREDALLEAVGLDAVFKHGDGNARDA
ncbi:MAG: rRNA maturation RNase YbeY [Phycisphaeraceae bacterium]